MDRYKSAKLASVLGIIGNIFLLVIKFFVAIITHSQSMLSDALNSAGDIISSIMTYIGNRIASKKPDKDHNLGHGKAEYIFSMWISIIMIIFSISVLKSSVLSIFSKNNYYFSNWLIIVCIVTIIVKLSLYLYTNKLSKKYNNLLIQASAYDHRNDCVLTTLTLVASIFGMYNITYVDGIIGSIISIWILITGIKILKESYDVLMDKGIDNELKKEILQIVKKYPEIEKINHLNATPVGYQYQISLTIFVDGNLSTFDSHEIANRLEKEITSLEEIYLTVIHVNPIKKESNK